MARPSIFTDDLGTALCARIAEGESLRSICKDDDMPSASTVFAWLLDSTKKEFSEQYAKARNIQAELMFEELLEIADETALDISVEENEDGSFHERTNHEAIQRSKLRVDTRKWYLSKVMPKKYGEKIDLTTDGKELPTPILAIPHVQPDNINEESSSS